MSKQGSSGRFTRLFDTTITSSAVADGDYLFDLNEHAPRNNIVEYFIFTDVDGAKVAATSGEVDIQLSGGEEVFQTIYDGTFNAVEALAISRRKPSGFGRAEKIKISLTGVVGAVGFKCLVSQTSR